MNEAATQALSLAEMEQICRTIEQEEEPKKPQPASPVAIQPPLIDAEQLRIDVTINPADLENAVITHASMFVHYAGQAAKARRQFERMKAAVEILESRLDAHYRQSFLEDGKKVTDKAIEASVKGDRRWWDAAEKLADARSMLDLANDAREAFSMRKDMIVQLAVDRREERKGDMRFSQKDALQAAGEAAQRSAQDLLKNHS